MTHWNEAKHPRVPAGNGDDSGQFTTVKVVGGKFNEIERLRAQHSGVRVSGDTFNFANGNGKLFAKSVNESGAGHVATIVPPHMRGRR